MGKQKLSVKMGLAYDEAVSYMRALVKSLESGKIVLESGEEHVTLIPGDMIDIKVEAKIKKDKQRISFEFSWCDTSEATLKIGDKEPEVSPEPIAEPETEAPAAPAEEKIKPEKKPEKKKEESDRKKKKDSKAGKKASKKAKKEKKEKSDK